MLIFVGILQLLRFDFKKFRILEILNFPPWGCKATNQPTKIFSIINFSIVASLCNREDCFELYSVRNPEDRFSRVMAQILYNRWQNSSSKNGMLYHNFIQTTVMLYFIQELDPVS